jgi:hypothetical protein
LKRIIPLSTFFPFYFLLRHTFLIKIPLSTSIFLFLFIFFVFCWDIFFYTNLTLSIKFSFYFLLKHIFNGFKSHSQHLFYIFLLKYILIQILLSTSNFSFFVFCWNIFF